MKPHADNNTAAGYVRRSAIDETGEDASIKYQKRYCEQIAARHGFEIVEWYDEGDGSPASIFKENTRPEYERALAGLGHSYHTLIAYAVDRLSRRGSGVIGHLLDLAEERGGRIITNDGLDTTNSAARLMATLMGEMARAETDRSSGRIRAQKESARLEGRPQGGVPPYGLQSVHDGDGRLVDFVVNEVEALAIQAMVEAYLEGASLRDVCQMMNDVGRFNRDGNPWKVPTVSRIFKYPHLVGWREAMGSLFTDENGDPIVVTTPIISEAAFHRLEAVASKKARPAGEGVQRRERNYIHLLSGLTRCGVCGGRMNHETFHNQKRIPTRNYSCRQCKPRNGIKAGLIEDYVVTAALHFIERVSQDPDSKIADEVAKRLMVKFTPEQASRREGVVEEIDAIKGRMKKFRRANLALTIDDDEYQDLEDRAGVRLAGLREELETLPEAPSNLYILHDLAIGSTDPDDLLGEESVWGKMTHHRRRDLLKVLIDEVRITARIKHRETDEESLSRLSIEFVTESNVVQMGRRRDRVERVPVRGKGTALAATA